MSKGKIIAVEGAQRSGKTFLVNQLAEALDAHKHVELDVAFPPRLVEDMEQNIRPFERILWFRNHLVRQFLDADERRKEGEVVIIDNFWNGYIRHIDALFENKDKFEKEICESLAELDTKILPYPDKIIFLELSDELTREFVTRGGREFDSSDKYFVEQILPVKREMEKFYNLPENQKNLVRINRETLDFSKQEDLNVIIEKLGL